MNDQSAITQVITKDWSLDHLAHAVSNLDESIEFYTRTFGFRLQSRETVGAHSVEIAMLELPNTKIELISPLPGNQSLQKFLERRGEGLHHITFQVTSIEQELERLKKLGIELIDSEPRCGAENAKVAFLHPRSTKGVLIELLSKDV